MKGKVFSLLLLLLGGAGTSLWLMLFHENDDNVRESRQLERLVRSLQETQQQVDKIKSHELTEDNKTVEHKFPWLPKKNTLPNFFHRTNEHLKNNYLSGTLVFGDNPHAVEFNFMECIHKISITKYLSISPIMSSGNRLSWEFSNNNSRRFTHKYKIHRGRYSFGICENVNVSCSYVMMFRNPLDQAMANYEYCKEELEDEMCQGVNANKVSLREWILYHGSELFNLLIFNPHFCTDSVVVNITIPDDVWFGNKKSPPCWLKQQVLMNQFSQLDIVHAVSYIINHLEQWFAVIGLHDESAISLKMLETVYKLPVTACYEISEKSKTSGMMNTARSHNRRQSRMFDENDPYYLQDDMFVRNALYADFRIYKAARRLFNIQKQLYTNKLRSL